MALGDGIRRNVATVSPQERTLLRDAFVAIDAAPYVFSDGVSFWDKQEQVHKDAHLAGQDVHVGPAFLPWHRVICNKLEALLRQFDSRLSLHYWDWTTDPRASPDGQGGTVNLMTPNFMGDDGSAGINRIAADGGGDIGPPFQNFESSEDDEIGNGHTHAWRNVVAGPPVFGPTSMQSDHSILTAGDVLPTVSQYHAMDTRLKIAHAYAHSAYIQGSIGKPHYSFHDPFVFLLHSNVDRLWATWQRAPGRSWRLDPSQTYGIDGSAPSIVADLEPWAGGTHLVPWAPPENQQTPITSKSASVVAPPVYDTDALGLVAATSDKWSHVAQILFGVTNDGSGVVLGPNGPHPVGPWGPLVANASHLAPAHQDALLGIAINELASMANTTELREQGLRAGTRMLTGAVKQLQKQHG
jgi:hypothetical protein